MARQNLWTIGLLAAAALGSCEKVAVVTEVDSPANSESLPQPPSNAGDASLFPDGLDGMYAFEGEPPLWPADAMRGYTQRLRMIEAGLPPSKAILIRIDTDLSGHATGHVVQLKNVDSTSRWTITERREFAVAPGSIDKLASLVERSDLWNKHPNFWVDENADCYDGSDLVIERASAGGYGFSEGNPECQRNESAEAIEAEMRALAGLP